MLAKFLMTGALLMTSTSAFGLFENYSNPDLALRLKSPQCERYLEITHEGKDQNPFKMDQLQVYKNGLKVDEYYRPGVYSADQYHVMMSASKAVSASILDAAIQSRLLFKGKPVTYESRLADFYPYEVRKNWILQFNQDLPAKSKKLIRLLPEDQKWYESVTLRHLTRMQAGFRWDESYNNPLGDFMSALYLRGVSDIVKASLSAPMEREPGTQFNYSGGNANIIQGIIRMIGAENYQLHNINMIANEILFSRIGIDDAFFETDHQGSAIGSTYLYLKPMGMARLGHLYLENGVWTYPDGRKEKILTDEFVRDMKSLNTAVDHAIISADYLKYIKAEGAPSNSITWLNQDIYDVSDTLRYGKEFPHSPDDMFFLGGHYGQVIMMLPTQKMVIVMTGRNSSYWDKIDKIVSSAINCFTDLKDAPDLTSWQSKGIAGNKSSSLPEKVWSSLSSVVQMTGPVLKLLYSPIPTAVVAKELCSCINVALPKSTVEQAIQNCPNDVPQFIQKTYRIQVQSDVGSPVKRIQVSTAFGEYPRVAEAVSPYGCRLVPYKK